jgi:DNA-binding MarR family transcriptional regulator
LLTRLLVRRARPDVSRTEAGVLRTLSDAPRRITELAELEGLVKPTMTLLVQRLEQRGWVERQRYPGNGWVVLVSLTDAGRPTLERFSIQVLAPLRSQLDAMSNEGIAELQAAPETLGSLVDTLQSGVAPAGTAICLIAASTMAMSCSVVPPLTPTPAITWPSLVSGTPPPIAEYLPPETARRG